MPRAGFEQATPTTKRPQTYALDRAATGIDIRCLYKPKTILWIMESWTALIIINIKCKKQWLLINNFILPLLQ
jgi:hypothetical protein